MNRSFFFVALVAACGAPHATRVVCHADTDCRAGEVCAAATCVAAAASPTGACTVDGDCSSGQTCNAGTCTTASHRGDCASAQDCPFGEFCATASGRCVECLSDDQCASGQTCNANGRCGPAGGGCTLDSDCGAQKCDTATGDCVDCRAATDCAPGEVCTDHACVTPPAGCTGPADCAANETCNVATGVCEPSLPADCDRTGFTLADAYGAADSAALSYQTLDADGDDGSFLWVENWPDVANLSVAPGSTATVDLANGNASYDTCGLCVGATSSGSGRESFVARSGSAAVTAPSGPGQPFTVQLTNAVLLGKRDGRIWCLPSLVISATADHYTCDYFVSDPAAGDTYCGEDGALIECQSHGSDLYVTRQTICSSSCDDSIAGAASCY